MNDGRVTALYDDLLRAIGDRAGVIAPRPLVAHWPHVGTAYSGLLIVGQALRGWPRPWQASKPATSEGRKDIVAIARSINADRADPLEWVPTSPYRNSPFWQFSRWAVERLEPGPTPWYSRYAWANLYPVAPVDPGENPVGPIRDAQSPFVGQLLLAIAEMLDARRIIAVAGPQYWYWARRTGELWHLLPASKPLTWTGDAYGRRWVVGYHPGWASRAGFGPKRYAELVAEAFPG